MFGGFGGGQNNKGTPNVTTKIRTMYGDTACLQMSYWNENVSIRINPFLGMNEQGIRQYDYNRRGSTALTTDKCIALADKIKDVILPEIEKVKTTKKLEKPINTGLSVGSKGSSFFIEYKPDAEGTPQLYATLYTNIGQDNKAPKDGVYSYKFTKTITVDNYDPESGTGIESISEAEFLYFYEKIRSIAEAQATAAHSVAVDSTYRGGRNNGNNQGNNQFRPSAPSQGAQPMQPMQPMQNMYAPPPAPQSNYTAPMSTFNSEDLPF